MGFSLKREGILPGFGLSLGFTVTYLSLIVLIPLAALFLRPLDMGWDKFFAAVTSPRVLAAYNTSLSTALIASGCSFLLGFVVAWTLVRYRFPWRRFLDAFAQ